MLTYLFNSKERLKILYYCFYRGEFTVAQVTKNTGVTKGLVSRYLNTLHKHKLLTRSKRTFVYINSSRTMAIKILLNLNKINEKKLIYKWMTGFGIFGSWATGTNTYESDIDVWIKTKTYPSELELSQLQNKIKIMTESEVNLIVLTPDKISELQQKDKPFYHSLIHDSIVLWGELI